MEYPNFNGIEYKPDSDGIATAVKCPLTNNWLEDIDCLESQAGFYLPEQKEKEIYKEICRNCPFRNY